MKVLICLCLILSFSNVMAKNEVGTCGGSESGGRSIHGGDSGDLYIISGDGSGGGKISGGEGGGESPAHK